MPERKAQRRRRGRVVYELGGSSIAQRAAQLRQLQQQATRQPGGVRVQHSRLLCDAELRQHVVMEQGQHLRVQEGQRLPR
jgi:hypothetical protein